MNVIAENANVSKATVYKHFKSKKDLFFALMMILSDEISKHTDIDYDKNASLKDQLLKFAKQKISFLCDKNNLILLKIGTVALSQENEITENLRKEFKDKIFENMIVWFQQAKEDGKMNIPDPLFVATQFFGSIKAFAFYPQMFGEKTLTKKKQQHVIETAVEAILLQYEK